MSYELTNNQLAKLQTLLQALRDGHVVDDTNGRVYHNSADDIANIVKRIDHCSIAYRSPYYFIRCCGKNKQWTDWIFDLRDQFEIALKSLADEDVLKKLGNNVGIGIVMLTENQVADASAPNDASEFINWLEQQ